MTSPDLTQPQRLDLEEGKRLREARRACTSTANVLAFNRWQFVNIDALIAAAEEAEKLREALRALEWAQNINPEADHCVECGGVRLGCSECGAEGSFTRHPDGSTTEPQHKPGCPIGAALPPQETP